MTKLQFILLLHEKLSGLPQDDIEERVSFYTEIIEDRMEDGLSEEEAVAAIGTIDSIATQILEEIPLTKIVKEKIRPKRRLKVWEIICLILGAPIWLSLLLSLLLVILSLYLTVWTVTLSFWAVFVSMVASAVGGILAGALFFFEGKAFIGAAIVGASIVCVGLSIFLFFGCKASTKGALWITKKIAIGIKKCFVKKEEA